jgi:hypothetical protein
MNPVGVGTIVLAQSGAYQGWQPAEWLTAHPSQRRGGWVGLGRVVHPPVPVRKGAYGWGTQRFLFREERKLRVVHPPTDVIGLVKVGRPSASILEPPLDHLYPALIT